MRQQLGDIIRIVTSCGGLDRASKRSAIDRTASYTST